MSKSGVIGLDHLKKIAKANIVSDTILEALNKVGEFALSSAPHLHEFENRTFNLEDLLNPEK